MNDKQGTKVMGRVIEDLVDSLDYLGDGEQVNKIKAVALAAAFAMVAVRSGIDEAMTVEIFNDMHAAAREDAK